MVIVHHPKLYIVNVQSFVFVVLVRLSFSNVEYENLHDSVRKLIRFQIHLFDIFHFSFVENNLHIIDHHYSTTWQLHEHYFQRSFARNHTQSMVMVIQQQYTNKSYFQCVLLHAMHWCIHEDCLLLELNEHVYHRREWHQHNDFDEHFQVDDHLESNHWDEQVEWNQIHRRQHCLWFSIENLVAKINQ